jgi:hypothetical protein
MLSCAWPWRWRHYVFSKHWEVFTKRGYENLVLQKKESTNKRKKTNNCVSCKQLSNSISGRGSVLVTACFSGESAVTLKQNVGLCSVTVEHVFWYVKLHASHLINSHQKIQALILEISFMLYFPFFVPSLSRCVVHFSGRSFKRH